MRAKSVAYSRQGPSGSSAYGARPCAPPPSACSGTGCANRVLRRPFRKIKSPPAMRAGRGPPAARSCAAGPLPAPSAVHLSQVNCRAAFDRLCVFIPRTPLPARCSTRDRPAPLPPTIFPARRCEVNLLDNVDSMLSIHAWIQPVLKPTQVSRKKKYRQMRLGGGGRMRAKSRLISGLSTVDRSSESRRTKSNTTNYPNKNIMKINQQIKTTMSLAAAMGTLALAYFGSGLYHLHRRLRRHHATHGRLSFPIAVGWSILVVGHPPIS